MRNWYKISQQNPLSQEWVTAMERTFDLMGFGRVKFRLRGYSSDKAGRDQLIFQSAPDPTLSDYNVRVRLDLNRGQVDVIVMENGQLKGTQSFAVNQQTLLQSPVQVAQTVKAMIEQESNYGTQQQPPREVPRVAKRLRD